MILNAAQREGVLAAGHCMITACPGSGKTRVLIERAKHLLADPNNRIAMITFTKDAAGEISERLLKAVGNISEDRVITGTFHAIAMKQINEMRKAEKLKPLTVLSDAQARILVRRAWREEAHTTPYMRVFKAIETAKSTEVPIADPRSPEARALNRYNQLLRERDAYDFSDLVNFAVTGILSNRIKPLNCTHMLVDEFQDVDQTQFNWVLAHVEAGIQVTVVGDDDQSIYKFRNALGFDGLVAFEEATNAKQITLGTTYRCSAQVMSSANRLIMKNEHRIHKTIQTAERRTGVVERRNYPNEADEALDAGRVLNERPKAEDPARHETAAILARTNKVLRTAETILLSEGIPYYRVGGGSIWDDGIPCMIRDLLGAFSGRGVNGIILMMHAMHCHRDLVARVNEKTKDMDNAADFLLTSEFWKKGMSADEKAAWVPIRNNLTQVRDALKANDISLALHHASAIASQAAGTRKSEKIAAAACKIISDMTGTLSQRLATLERRERKAKDLSKDRGRIALMTLHGAKGLEFDWVWMMGLNHGVLPHQDSTVDEERRLCYVGMTRAKTHLVMSTSVEEGKASQFLAEIGLFTDAVSLKAG